jgi:hypothetical protein
MFLFKKIFFTIIFITAIIIFFSCEEEIVNPDIPESEIIGTWVLTKIIVSYPIGEREITPQSRNLALTIELKSNNTFMRHQNNQGEITNDQGTWSIEMGVLALVTSSNTYTFPCRLNNNILLAATSVIDPDTKFLIPLKLELTKQ